MTRLLPLFTLLALFMASPGQAQTGSERFGDYQVYYSVFNSTFVLPDVASIHGLVRGNDRALVNISVSRVDGGLGVPATLTGTATNLLQQAQTLEFQEISEGDTTYYIAPMRHLNEERYHFRISLQPEDSEQAFTLQFTQTLYQER
ncbi:DUF4426 domain-containing protein [Marinimicrobium sp. ARAG 43.8]|uniref:DUF4426 domain-containing protein n=1 Tax=Marinimicrobium sp. ARAG 43.8 TaxID=3418719 RepID=UPI003CE68089